MDARLQFVNHDEAFLNYSQEKSRDNLFWLCIGLNAGGMWRTSKRVIKKNRAELGEYFKETSIIDQIVFNNPFLINCYSIAYSHYWGIQMYETSNRLQNIIPDVKLANQFVEQIILSSDMKIAFDEVFFLDGLRDNYLSFVLDWILINSDEFVEFDSLLHDQLLLLMHYKIIQNQCQPEFIEYFYIKFRFSVQFYALSRNLYGTTYKQSYRFARRWIEIASRVPY